MAQNKETWTSFKENRTSIDLYTEDAVIVYVPTLVGVRGNTQIRKFFLHPHFSQKANTVKETVMDTLVSTNKLFEESVWTIHFYSGVCNWLVPDIEERYLVNATVKFPVTTSVSFVNEKIQSVRFYWDQACILKQLKVIPDQTQWPVIGEQQADALQLSKGMTLRDLNDSQGKIVSNQSLPGSNAPTIRPLRPSETPPARNIFTYEPPSQRPLVAPHPNKLGSSIVLGEEKETNVGYKSSNSRQIAIHYPGAATENCV
ncbi:hypothetical protein G6F56_006458 [Rhizopus delemar]|nr:hypothetical protein G6F56_006458 [Rhizopus delemar]